MKIIKDPVHGYVEVAKEMLPLLDSAPVQRLRHIRQLGFSHLVYPGANHTRFEHSLGCMHLAGVHSRHLGLDADDTRLVTSAALLHDIGHGPYSHATEPLMEEYLRRDHQEIEHLLAGDATAEILRELTLDPAEIGRVIHGEHPLSGIIHGDLDVDRMDYLLRDAHYTGVPYGTVDAHRLIRSTIRTEHGMVLAESGIGAAESLLIARTLMRPAVYFHHVSRIAESMVKYAALEHLNDVRVGGCEALLGQDDATFLRELLGSQNPLTREMMERLYGRRLYKRALYVGKAQVNPTSIQRCGTLREGRSIAEEIAERAGVDPSSVLVDIPPFPSLMSMEVQVRNRHDLVHLEEISPLMKALNENRRELWRMGVYAPREHLAAVSEAATEVLHVKKATKQDRLTL
jgi:HD superfamily phosphohydrolase